MRIPVTAVHMLILFSVAGLPDTIHVPADQPTIQAGIDTAVNGDTVLVAPGTYLENIDFLGKAITVKGDQGPHVTVIDGGTPTNPDFGSVVTFETGETADSVLEGFSIVNGTGRWILLYSIGYYGGGIFCLEASPTIRGNILSGNSARHGGGIFCYALHSPCAPVITGNTIRRNTTKKSGGGIDCALFFPGNPSPVIHDNLITENVCGNHGGGGISCHGYDCTAIITHNAIVGNCADMKGKGGGGIYAEDSRTMIMYNLIADNTAGHGGGIMGPGFSILSNHILRNAAESGGGIDLGFMYGSPRIANNIISENTALDEGGGIRLNGQNCFYSLIYLENNTLTFNEAKIGGGIYLDWPESDLEIVQVVNTILWDNKADVGPEIRLGYSNGFGVNPTFTIQHSNVKGGMTSMSIEFGWTFNWGPGMIDADPCFVDGAGGDFHLRFDSPCRDTGCNVVPYLPKYDIEGDPRTFNGVADMGADEFHIHLYGTGDFTPGGRVKGMLIGRPASAPVGLFFGSSVLDPPLPTPWGPFHLAPPLQLAVLWPVPPSGVIEFSAQIPQWFPAPFDLPMQALVEDVLTNHWAMEIR